MAGSLQDSAVTVNAAVHADFADATDKYADVDPHIAQRCHQETLTCNEPATTVKVQTFVCKSATPRDTT